MGHRKRTAASNFAMVLATLLAVLLFSTTGRADNKFGSQGKIVFDNKTQDTADDVVFDAGDFDRLSSVCR